MAGFHAVKRRERQNVHLTFDVRVQLGEARPAPDNAGE